MPSPRRQAPLSTIGEFQLIQSITPTRSNPSPQIILGLGDDGALLKVPKGRHIVVSTDLLIEQVHFDRRSATFFDIGYKAASANLSDMAAMGANPTTLLVSVALPGSLTFQDWKELYRGLSVPCLTHHIQIAGGDTSSSPSHIFISVTVLGTVKPGCALLRNGAKPGHEVYVSGTLGDSSAGLDYLKKNKNRGRFKSSQPRWACHLTRRYLHPTPRIALGRLLGTRHWASAAIDISDGLSNDLRHICQQSHVGALIDSNQLPLSPSLKRYAKGEKVDPLRWALHGGEDYELLFSVPPQYAKNVEVAARRLSIPITKIGVITPYQSRICLRDPDGHVTLLTPRGYDHFPS